MTVGHSKELAKLIIELANNKKVNKEKLFLKNQLKNK